MMIVISVTASYADGAYRLPGKLDVLPVSVTERKSDYAILLFVYYFLCLTSTPKSSKSFVSNSSISITKEIFIR